MSGMGRTVAIVAAMIALAVVAWVLFFRGGSKNEQAGSESGKQVSTGKASTKARSASRTATEAAPQKRTVRKLAAKRDRERLLRAIAAAHRARASRGAAASNDAGPATTGGAAAAPALPIPLGKLDKRYIRSVIRGAVPMLADCYKLARDTAPNLEGKVMVEFTIIAAEDVGGLVETAAVMSDNELSKHAVMSECLTQTMLSLEYPAPKEGGKVTVRYPFEFHN